MLLTNLLAGHCHVNLWPLDNKASVLPLCCRWSCHDLILLYAKVQSANSKLFKFQNLIFLQKKKILFLKE